MSRCATPPFAASPGLAWGLRVLRCAGLVAAVIAVANAGHPDTHGRAMVITVCLVVAAIGWLLWISGEHRPPVMAIGLGVLAAAGGVLATVVPTLAGLLFGTFATFMAGDGLPLALAVAVALVAETAVVTSQIVADASTVRLVGAAVMFAAGLFVGLVRARTRQRADQAELLLAQTRRARAAEAASAALAERGRIAREIHDLLAHALAGLTVQLQAAHALLDSETLPADDPHLSAAIGCVTHAEHLARQGMTETRRAIHALREDPVPLPDLLAALTRDSDARLRVVGTRVPLRPEAGLALYRTAQEALTNARKHAPGTPVTVHLDYADDHVAVTVTNASGNPHSPRPLTNTGGGHGLIGLRERAELAGGTLTAGAHDGGWRVHVRIPQ